MAYPNKAAEGPWKDTVVEEVRASREQIFAECGYDLKQLVHRLRQEQQSSGRKSVTRSPRPAVGPVPQPHNKQLQRTVIRQHVRAANAPFHHALAARFTRQRAAAELQRQAATMERRGVTPGARAVSYRLRPVFVLVFGMAGFFYGLWYPFLVFDWSEPVLRIGSAAVGLLAGALLGWVLCYIAPLRTP